MYRWGWLLLRIRLVRHRLRIRLVRHRLSHHWCRRWLPGAQAGARVHPIRLPSKTQVSVSCGPMRTETFTRASFGAGAKHVHLSVLVTNGLGSSHWLPTRRSRRRGGHDSGAFGQRWIIPSCRDTIRPVRPSRGGILVTLHPPARGRNKGLSLDMATVRLDRPHLVNPSILYASLRFFGSIRACSQPLWFSPRSWTVYTRCDLPPMAGWRRVADVRGT